MYREGKGCVWEALVRPKVTTPCHTLLLWVRVSVIQESLDPIKKQQPPQVRLVRPAGQELIADEKTLIPRGRH